jgi:hypothetical protein
MKLWYTESIKKGRSEGKGRISFLKCHERQFKAAPTVTSRPQNTRPHHQPTTLSIIIIISSPAMEQAVLIICIYKQVDTRMTIENDVGW